MQKHILRIPVSIKGALPIFAALVAEVSYNVETMDIGNGPFQVRIKGFRWFLQSFIICCISGSISCAGSTHLHVNEMTQKSGYREVPVVELGAWLKDPGLSGGSKRDFGPSSSYLRVYLRIYHNLVHVSIGLFAFVLPLACPTDRTL